MNKLINLIPNSNFEELNFNPSTNETMLNDWTIDNIEQVCSKYSFNGAYSINLSCVDYDYIDTSLQCQVKALANTQNVLIRGHKYYIRQYYKYKEKALDDETFKLNVMHVINNNYTILFDSEFKLSSTKYLNWNLHSYIFQVNKDFNNCMIELTQTTWNTTVDILVDSFLLIDLTETFGEGCEPSKEWCDTNIPYFKNEYDLALLPKEIEFTCKDQFVYHPDTKKYYTDNYSPKITFVIRNIDKHYNDDKLQDLLNKTRLDCTIYNKGNEVTFSEQLTIDKLNVTYIDNDCYVEYNEFKFKEYRHHAKLEIYSDLSNGTIVKDELTIYFIGKYNNNDNLQWNFDYNLSYASTYVRQLNGTTNAYVDVPMSIEVFINDVKTSPVNILNQDDKLTEFEKDLYLNDGINVIKVVATDVCGNSQSKVTEIYVDCMPSKPEKKDLLTNFIADDDLKISLDIGNADLKYETKSAGLDKEVLIDTSIDSHFFKLIGENSKLYRISKDNIPKIHGDIIKRPLNVTYDYVEKIYDGTTDISNEIRKLKLDDGYYLRNTHKEYNDYAGAGFVKEIVERRVTSEMLAKAYECVKTEYILDKPNIDFSTIYINIDGIEGYALYEPDNDIANIILQNDSLSNIFKSIKLSRNQSNNNSVLKFTYQDDIELEYKLISGLNIKYNYNDKSGSEYITYAMSDEGTLAVDFKNAFFRTKDVTDEIQDITINDIKFIGDVLGDTSNNYQLTAYSSTGKILRRTIYPHIVCLDKVYDGSTVVPIKIDETYYQGLENSIPGDDIYLDIAYEGDKDSETHIFTKSGNTILTTNNPDVENNKDVTLNRIILEGHDAKNYTLGNVISEYKMNIFKRPISIVVNKLRFIRATRRWEMEYTILNDIKSDKLTVIYNTNDNYDIKVYGGVDIDGNSIHSKYTEIPDIVTLFFNYPFNPEYQFKNIETEVTRVSEDKTTAYWKNEARPAEPDTERIDIIKEVNTDYPGEIKFTLDDTLSNGVRTYYFESENKEYKLYNGCKVMITNINLNPLNDKLKNYTLLNSTYETKIEIV